MTMQPTHTVSLENVFHGPLDLMLYLVKRDEIDIHDIPISHLTHEYMAELERMRDLDVDVASEFLSVASMLVEIKSRMLLPPAEIENPEDEDEDPLVDPRTGLVQALLEYKRFKEAAAALGEMAEIHALRFARIAPLPEFAPDPDDAEEDAEVANVLDLLVAFQKMARSLSAGAQEIVNDEIPTEVRLEIMENRLRKEPRVSFSSLLSSHPTKGEMVGFFIAMLELIRLKKVLAEQSADFTEIYILKREPEAPVRKSGRILIQAPFIQYQPCTDGTSRIIKGLFSPLSRQSLTAGAARLNTARTAAFLPVASRQGPTEKAKENTGRPLSWLSFMPVPQRERKRQIKPLLHKAILGDEVAKESASQKSQNGAAITSSDQAKKIHVSTRRLPEKSKEKIRTVHDALGLAVLIHQQMKDCGKNVVSIFTFPPAVISARINQTLGTLLAMPGKVIAQFPAAVPGRWNKAHTPRQTKHQTENTLPPIETTSMDGVIIHHRCACCHDGEQNVRSDNDSSAKPQPRGKAAFFASFRKDMSPALDAKLNSQTALCKFGSRTGHIAAFPTPATPRHSGLTKASASSIRSSLASPVGAVRRKR